MFGRKLKDHLKDHLVSYKKSNNFDTCTMYIATYDVNLVSFPDPTLS